MSKIDERIDKAANEFADSNHLLLSAYNKAAYNGFIAGANFALSHQWRSVEEELPNHNHLVIVLCDSDEPELRYTTAAYIDGIWRYPDEWYYDIPVLMWMPIPPLPEARKEGEE